jgi:hypothetical protein
MVVINSTAILMDWKSALDASFVRGLAQQMRFTLKALTTKMNSDIRQVSAMARSIKLIICDAFFAAYASRLAQLAR